MLQQSVNGWQMVRWLRRVRVRIGLQDLPLEGKGMNKNVEIQSLKTSAITLLDSNDVDYLECCFETFLPNVAPLFSRFFKIARDRSNGKTYEKIGIAFGVCRARVREVERERAYRLHRYLKNFNFDIHCRSDKPDLPIVPPEPNVPQSGGGGALT